MEKSISKTVKAVVKKTMQDPEMNKFIEASNYYEQLVREGLATKRGFNIKTLQEIYQPNSPTFYEKPH
jgi:hypothetical protein